MDSNLLKRRALRAAWVQLNLIGVLESERTESGKPTVEMRYYIGSIVPDAKRFAHAVRGH